MASNLECIGFDISDRGEFSRLVCLAADSASVLGKRDGHTVVRWQDDEGARLVLVLDASNKIHELTPSFASEPGAVLESLCQLNGEIWAADVMAQGEKVTALAADLEQAALLVPSPDLGGRAGIVALGVAIEVFADDDAFGASRASLLNPEKEVAEETDDGSQAPAEDGVRPRIHRMAAESFISYGVFGDPSRADAYARLNGTVLRSRTCRNSLTGKLFQVARVRTAGFEADVCLAASEHTEAPAPGSIVGGTVYLVAALESVPEPAEEQIQPRRGRRLPWRR